MMGNQRNDTMLYGINYKHLTYKLQSKRKAKKRISFNTQLNKTVVAARPRRDRGGGGGGNILKKLYSSERAESNAGGTL